MSACTKEQNERHLIAVDLDNTVLSDLFSLDSTSVCALIRAQEVGHLVMIATARPTCMSLPYHRAMGLYAPLSVLNGAYLYHPDDVSFPHRACCIGTDEMALLSGAVREIGLDTAIIECDDEVYFTGATKPDLHQYFREILRQSHSQQVESLPAVPVGRFFASTASLEKALAFEAVVAANPQLSYRRFTDGSQYRISCYASAANKWETVQYVAQYYHIPPERIITFGDEENDRRMIWSAANGFVMCNGNPRLIEDAKRDHVRITTRACTEGGVAAEIKQLLSL